MFDGFTLTRRAGNGAELRARYGGSGPAVLLLRGHPRTHATWHSVAPLLVAAGHTVVCPDLRGYGESSKPPTDQEHRPYSKRARAGDCLALMRGLGHERFAVVGHDRGAYVATRLALDHPAAVSASRGHAAGGPLRLLTVGGVCAVVQDVPAAEFSEAALRDRLPDAAELERCARTHHEVVTAAASAGPTVPLPLATLYLDDERAGTALRENQDRFGAVLERITGRAEWAVKVYMTHADALSRSAVPAPPEKPPPNTQPGPQQRSGRAYMNRLRGRQQLRESQREAALAAAERVGSALRELAVGTVQRRPHGPEVTGKDWIHHVATDIAAWSHEHVRRLAEALPRYGLSPGGASGGRRDGGPCAALPRSTGDMAGHRSEPGLSLLCDLRDLHLAAAYNSLHWEMLAQVAQAAKAADLLSLATSCHPRTLRQLRWTNTMVKTLSPQVLSSL